jgi:SSS family solute:Na+ symporter
MEETRGVAREHALKLSRPLHWKSGENGMDHLPLRETQAMTLAQFLEMRYSRQFRLFSGILCRVSGMVNYGNFPAMSGRFILPTNLRVQAAFGRSS